MAPYSGPQGHDRLISAITRLHRLGGRSHPLRGRGYAKPGRTRRRSRPRSVFGFGTALAVPAGLSIGRRQAGAIGRTLLHRTRTGMGAHHVGVLPTGNGGGELPPLLTGSRGAAEPRHPGSFPLTIPPPSLFTGACAPSRLADGISQPNLRQSRRRPARKSSKCCHADDFSCAPYE